MMKNSLYFVFLTIFFATCVSCGSGSSGSGSSGGDDNSISVKLNSDASSYYNCKDIHLTTVVTNPSGKKVSYTWFKDGSQMTTVDNNLSEVYTSVYVTETTPVKFSVQVSNGVTTASSDATVQIVPYTESDAASLTITNVSGMNLYQVFFEPQDNLIQRAEVNVLTIPYLSSGNSITLYNLMPGSYWVSGTDINGQNNTNGYYGVFPIEGSNSFSLP